MTAILVNAKPQGPTQDGQIVRELHPAPGSLPAIIALTTDAGLSQAVQEIATTAAGLSLVESVEHFSERLMGGASGIALIDSAAVPTAIPEFVDGIARQFPEVVLVVAGGLAEQGQLAAQIGSGRVYRFVHKPASAQRLKLFIEAAARHQAELLRQSAAPVPATQKTAPQPAPASSGSGKPTLPSKQLYLGAGIAAAVLLGVVLFFALRGGSGAKPDAAPVAAVPVRDLRAEQAAAQARAKAELEQLLGNAETALTEARIDEAERLAVAAQAIAQAQSAGAENSRVKFLQTQIARERERLAEDEKHLSALGARRERVASYVRLADERMQKGSLIEPARDSALFYVEGALDLAPNDAGAAQSRGSLVRLLLAAAERSLASNEIDVARRLADAAAGLDAPKAELERLRRRADELRSSGVSALPAAVSAATPAAASTPTSTSTVTSTTATPATAPSSAGAPAAGGNGGSGASVVSATALNRVRSFEVQYPEMARLRGQTGYVDLEFTVAVNGSVKDVTVIDAQPRNLFESSAVTAVRKWRYAPVLRDGAAVEQRARLRVRFSGN